MPLYIADMEMVGEGLPPLLLGTSNLRILSPSTVKRMEYGADRAVLLDIFEIANDGFANKPYVILPNGCPSLIFVLHAQTPVCHLCGPLTTARRIEIPAKGILFCVRFRVGGLDWLGKASSLTFTDRMVPPQKYFLDADYLFSQLCCMNTFQRRCEVVIAAVEQMRENVCRIDMMVQTCLDHIHKSGGKVRVSELAAAVSRSERFLSRSFRTVTGLSVKTYCEIVKFQNSLYSILADNPRNLSSVVKSYGYYDLPHMNRAYRKFLNYTASDVRYLSLEELYVPLLFEGGSMQYRLG